MPFTFLPKKDERGRLTRFWEQFPDFWHEEELSLSGLNTYSDPAKNQFIVEAELPGFKQEELEINLDQGLLWIKAEKKEEQENKDRKYYRKTETSRTYRYLLPEQINEQAEPKASYQDGILKITFETSKNSGKKKITVKPN